MGIMDDGLAALWRNEARSDRASGKSGTFSDAMANIHARHSASQEAEAVLRKAGNQIASQLTELATRQASASAAANARIRAEERALEDQEKRNRIAAIQAVSHAIETFTTHSTTWADGSPVIDELFCDWVHLKKAAVTLSEHKVDDPTLVRDVARSVAQVERIIDQAGLRSGFSDDATRIPTLLVHLSGAVQSLVGLQLKSDDNSSLRGGARRPVQAKQLALSRVEANKQLNVLKKFCENATPIVQAYAQSGALKIGNDANLQFGKRFSAFDGHPVFGGSGANHNQFCHDDSEAGVARLAAALAIPESAGKVLDNARASTDAHFAPLIEEYQFQLDLIRSSGSLEDAREQIEGRSVKFQEVGDFFAKAHEARKPPFSALVNPKNGWQSVVLLIGILLTIPVIALSKAFDAGIIGNGSSTPTALMIIGVVGSAMFFVGGPLALRATRAATRRQLVDGLMRGAEGITSSQR